MLPSLLITAAIAAPGAPIPKDAVPNTTGPAPRVVAVKSDTNGSVWITAQVWEKRKVQQQFFAVENGKQVMKQQEVEQNVSNYIHKAIGDFGAVFSTADGAALSTEEATKRVKDGATLLVTADGKPIDRAWLRAVEGDTVVPKGWRTPTSSTTCTTPPTRHFQRPPRLGWLCFVRTRPEP
jgi:hypothetical protein